MSSDEARGTALPVQRWLRGAHGRRSTARFGWSGGVRPVDTHLTSSGELLLTLELPGVEKEDVEASIEESRLTVRAIRRPSRAALPVREEELIQKFSIPPAVDVDRVHADFRNGLLTITLPPIERRKFSPGDVARLQADWLLRDLTESIEPFLEADLTTPQVLETNEVAENEGVTVTPLNEDESATLVSELGETLGAHSWILQSICTAPVQLTAQIPLDVNQLDELATARPVQFRVPAIPDAAVDPDSVAFLARFDSGAVRGISADVVKDRDELLVRLWEPTGLLDPGERLLRARVPDARSYTATVTLVGVCASIYG